MGSSPLPRADSPEPGEHHARLATDSPDFLAYIGGIGDISVPPDAGPTPGRARLELAKKASPTVVADGAETTIERDGLRTKHKDGSVFTEKKNQDGSTDYLGSGKAPVDNYHVHQSRDGSYTVLDATGKRVKRSDDSDVAAQRQRLDTLSGNFTNPEDKARFRADMSKLESRLQGNPKEIAETYYQVASLLQQRDNARVKPEVVDRLAMDVMSHAGTSKSVDQGPHPTCNVSSVESVMYHDNPSIPAQVIKDLALTGEHKLPSGQVVKVDEQSLQSASLSRRADGNRSLATQYMNVLMVNTALAKKGEHYTSNDQRIKDVDGKTPEVVGKAPDLSLGEIAQSYKAIMGDKAKGTIIIAHDSEAQRDAQGKIIPVDGVEYFHDEKSYEQLLDRLKKTQGLPVAEMIDVRNNFAPPGSACVMPMGEDIYDAHLLDIDDISKGVVEINNQWGSACRYPLPAKQAYEASIDKELSIMARIEKAKDDGSRDFAAELMHSHTLMRQENHIPGFHVPGGEVMSNLDFYLREAQKMTEQGKPEIFGKEAAKEFADLAVDMLPLQYRSIAADTMRSSGLFKKYPELIDLVNDIS